MPFRLGSMPSKRTVEYLSQGKILLRPQVKVVVLAYNTSTERSAGANEFVKWHWSQLQYRNPAVQLVQFKNKTPNPYFQVYLDDASEVLIDVDYQTRQAIHDRLNKVVGKTEIVLEREALEREIGRPPANFGSDCRRQCICEVQGQQPCSWQVPAPRHYMGLWRKNYEHVEEKLQKLKEKSFLVSNTEAQD